MITEFESYIVRDIPIKPHGKPNGALLLIDWCIKNYLDNERSLINVGAFTGRDLDWMLPICSKYAKPIECVEHWQTPFLKEPIRNQMIKEVEKTRGHPLVTWTWDDAINAKTISSADFFFMGTLWNEFDLQNHMRSINHSSIWMLDKATIWWGIKLLSSLIHQEKIFHMLSSPNIFLFTNDPFIHEQFINDFEKLKTLVEKYDQFIQLCNGCIRMNHEWKKRSSSSNYDLNTYIKELEKQYL